MRIALGIGAIEFKRSLGAGHALLERNEDVGLDVGSAPWSGGLWTAAAKSPEASTGTT